MKSRLFVFIAAFVVFSGYTAFIVITQGYFGFLQVPSLSAWGAQVFWDLLIALSLFFFWMLGDAKRLGISPWPYAAAILTTGSIGALAYLIHRSLKESGTPELTATAE